MTDAMAARQGSWSAPSGTTAAQARKQSKSESESSSSPTSTANQTSNVGPVRKLPPRKGDTKRNADGKPTRKKVAKACLACQKSHLTCDESE
jgi:hypothetical protein